MQGEEVREIIVPRARYGFEVVLMVIMDEEN
jgi:hypothetical protein